MIPIEVNGKPRPIGFKFLCPREYPREPPYVFLDEPLNEQVIEVYDYIDDGNRIRFSFLSTWAARVDDPAH